MTPKLKPCPWCGTIPRFDQGWSSEGGHKWGAWVTCRSRRCQVGPQMGIVQDGCENTREFKEKAIGLWNCRPPRRPKGGK